MASQTLRLTHYARILGKRDRKADRTSQALSSTPHAQLSDPRHSALPPETMASPTVTPTHPPAISERRHSDPPALWIGMISASVAIHVVALGVLRLLAIGGFPGWQFNKALIPVDVIVVASKTTTPSQTTLTPNSTSAIKRSPLNPPINRTSNQGFNRQTSSVSTPSSASSNSQPTRIPTSEPNQFQNESPATNPSQNQSPGTPTSPTNPDSPTNNGTQPGGTTPSSDPNPVPPVEPSGGQNSPNAEQGGGFLVNISGLRLSNPDKDIPNQPAQVIINSEQLVTDLNQPVVLEMLLLIDRNGKATLQVPPKVVQGSSNVDPTQLAQIVIQNSQFIPARMENDMVDDVVDQEYYLTVSIRPKTN